MKWIVRKAATAEELADKLTRVAEKMEILRPPVIVRESSTAWTAFIYVSKEDSGA